MNKVIEYQIVTSGGGSNEFNTEINGLIKQGFQPLGGVSTCVDEGNRFLVQAMVKYETTGKFGAAV